MVECVEKIFITLPIIRFWEANYLISLLITSYRSGSRCCCGWYGFAVTLTLLSVNHQQIHFGGCKIHFGGCKVSVGTANPGRICGTKRWNQIVIYVSVHSVRLSQHHATNINQSETTKTPTMTRGNVLGTFQSYPLNFVRNTWNSEADRRLTHRLETTSPRHTGRLQRAESIVSATLVAPSADAPSHSLQSERRACVPSASRAASPRRSEIRHVLSFSHNFSKKFSKIFKTIFKKF